MRHKSTLEVLTTARTFIAKPENWCRNLRDDLNGAHCALGAIDRVYDLNLVQDDEPAIVALAKAVDDFGFEAPKHEDLSGYCALSWRIADFNNSRSHGEVLAVFDLAIATERAKIKDLTPQVRSIIDDALAAMPELVGQS